MIRLNGLTGGLAGSFLVALGFAASVMVAPPVPQEAPMPPDAPLTVQTPGTETAPLPAAPAEPLANAAAQGGPTTSRPDTVPPGEADTPEASAPQAMTDAAPAPETVPNDPALDAAPELDTELNTELDTGTPANPDPSEIGDASQTGLPEPESSMPPAGLPAAPMPPRDQPLPQVPDNPASDANTPAPLLQTDPDVETGPDTTLPDTTLPDTTLPGAPVRGMPGQPASQPPSAEQSLPEPDISALTALERNSLFAGLPGSAPLMAVILNDPGLPTPLRRALAALDLPITVALNPMDPSAGQAAEIYRDAGKEVLILASGLPLNAQATDLDVTFGAWFDALPDAIGVLDLPREGFARNASLTNAVLPLVARDGHGLVSFAGGLSRVGPAAERAGVAHAEVFRVLDDESQSAFTIRRYLDRAVFQASQIGEVIVFGDATNDATMEALEMWSAEGRADQVAVVPVSAILLAR